MLIKYATDELLQHAPCSLCSPHTALQEHMDAIKHALTDKGVQLKDFHPKELHTGMRATASISMAAGSCRPLGLCVGTTYLQRSSMRRWTW